VAAVLSVIVPARNEADRIADTVSALKRLECVGEVIVVDDGSTDGTGDVARRAGADAVVAGPGRDKGGAMEAGLARATHAYVGFADADLGESVCEFALLAAPVLSGQADLAIALFPKPGRPPRSSRGQVDERTLGRRTPLSPPFSRGETPGVPPPLQGGERGGIGDEAGGPMVLRAGAQTGGFGVVVGVAKWGIRRLGGVDLGAPICGQRVMTRELCHSMLPFARGYGVEVGMDIDAARLGARIVEVPVQMSHRALGRTPAGFAHRGRQLLDVLAALWSRRGPRT
jgi:hypothetical protein